MLHDGKQIAAVLKIAAKCSKGCMLIFSIIV